jgi:RND superfamily putative drug exporter
MFSYLGRVAVKYSWQVILAGALLIIFGAFYSRDVMQRLTLAPGWDVPGSGSAESVRLLRERLGRDETPVILLFRPRSDDLGDVDSPAYRSAVEVVTASISRNPEVVSVVSYHSGGDARLHSKDKRLSYAIVQLQRGKDEGIAAFERLRGQIRSAQLEVMLGGELATYADIREQLARDIWHAEIASFIALALLLVWVFGSVAAAMLPLVVGLVTIVLSVSLLKFFTLFIDISAYASNVVSMLGLGLAIDYALFIVSRFREELAAGHDIDASLMITLRTAGRTVVYSGLTVASSLFCLHLLPQRFFQNMGLAGGISVAAAMVTAVVLLPALLALLGPRVNRRGDRRVVQPSLLEIGHRTTDLAEAGRWYRYSHFVMRRAWPVLILTLTLLLAMGWPVLHMQIGPADSKSLPVTAESRQVQEILNQRFAHSDMGPLVLAIQTRGAAHSAAALAGLDAYTQSLRALSGVVKVSGLTSVDPKLSLKDYQLLYAYPDQFPLAQETLDSYAKGDYCMLYVEYSPPPSSEAARDLVRHIRALAVPASLLQVQVGGFPAFHLDYLHSLRVWVPWTIAAIVCVIFVLLFFMLGSVFIPLKAVITNLLSLSATFGALVWVFQDGNFSQWFNFTPQGSMDGTILVLIFAAAFGLSIDYEVFLLSRIKEMAQTTGDNMRSVAVGIQRSGPIITSAALLIGIVLGAFAMGEVVFMKAMGLGLLLSVLVDATLVRMLLVPASLRLLGRLNWWAPKPLMKLYQRFNLSEIEAHRREEKP